MYRNVVAPILLVISGAFNLFPKTLERFVNIGYEPITLQTVVGLISVILAIGILSTLRIKGNDQK